MQFSWHNKHVLIAEDDLINFKYLDLIFTRKTGVNVIWAKDGQEAYQKIINHSAIDIVLLDLQLPELNGFDVLRLSKAVIPELPIIMQTAHTWQNEEENCFKLGANGFFSKPLNIDGLFIKMDECMKEYAKVKGQIVFPLKPSQL